MNTFSQRLKKFRDNRGYSQETLAEDLGVSKATVVRWESGTTKPSKLAADTLGKIGFGKIISDETNRDSLPRLNHMPTEKLRQAIKKKIQLGGKKYTFEPSPFVINGPENQFVILFPGRMIDN
jgi:DNA-binding XRE family transcriptional regulator